MATITMEKHITTDKLQAALSTIGNYTIESSDSLKHDSKGTHSPSHHMDGHTHHQPAQGIKTRGGGSGIYYCPMHCEGETLYHQSGSCPIRSEASRVGKEC